MAAPPEAVWKHLADPATWSEWNTRIQIVRRDRDGELRASEQFSAQLQVQDRLVASHVVVSRCHKEAKLELVQNFEDSQRRRMVKVKFRLAPTRGGGTRVSQEVDLGRSGVSLLARTVSVVLHKLGRSEEFSPLENLKRLVESGITHPVANGVALANGIQQSPG